MERRASSPDPLKPPWDGYFISSSLGGPRLHRLWKDSDFDFALKGRGFSRAVIAVKWRER
jgi:hypothetical protein